MNIQKTLQQRGARHGNFTDNAAISQALKNVVRSHPNSKKFSPIVSEALDMILHKVARIVSGDPTYADHWHDIQGYAKLVEDRV